MSFSNPLQFVSAVTTVGTDAIKLVQALKASDKTAAIADTLDALPALAILTSEPVADVQAFFTAERLGIAYDIEQEAPTVIALVKAALATYRATL